MIFDHQLLSILDILVPSRPAIEPKARRVGKSAAEGGLCRLLRGVDRLSLIGMGVGMECHGIDSKFVIFDHKLSVNSCTSCQRWPAIELNL